MHEYDAVPYLRETLVFLALAGILIPLLQRLRVNQVLGFLAAGALIGPLGLGSLSTKAPWLNYVTFMRPEGIAALGGIGILFLMFMIGLELSTERLWAMRRWVFGAGTAQVAFSAMLIGSLAWLFGNQLETAAILGLVLSLSSTAVVMQLLEGRRGASPSLRQSAFSILMLQDLAVVPIFILMGVVARGTEASLVPLIGMTVLKSIAAVTLIYLLGRRLVRPLYAAFARQRQPEVFMALTLLFSLGIAAATAASGLSMALGAFLAGLLLAETEFRHEVEVVIEPFRGLFMGLFFLSVGMQIDVREIARSPIWIPLSVLGLFAIKTAVTGIILRAGGFNWGRALAGGLLLGQGGEFAFIVVGQALAIGLMPASVGQFMMLVVSLSLFVTPFAARAGDLCAQWWEKRHPEPAPDASIAVLPPVSGRVIIAGFGRVGQLLARVLESTDIPYAALESDAKLASMHHAEGAPVFFGDAARADLLHRLHAADAAAIVLTMDQPSATLHALNAIRTAFPGLPVFARSRDEKHALELLRAGATMVLPETLETGLQLSNVLLQNLGMAEAEAVRIVGRERERRIAQLRDGLPGTGS